MCKKKQKQKRMLVHDFRMDLGNPGYAHLKTLNLIASENLIFQIFQHLLSSKILFMVPRVRTWTYHFRGHNLAHYSHRISLSVAFKLIDPYKEMLAHEMKSFYNLWSKSNPVI